MPDGNNGIFDAQRCPPHIPTDVVDAMPFRFQRASTPSRGRQFGLHMPGGDGKGPSIMDMATSR